MEGGTVYVQFESDKSIQKLQKRFTLTREKAEEYYERFAEGVI